MNRVLELKHLQVHALQHKVGDPFSHERTDGARARSMGGAWSEIHTQTILLLCDIGLSTLVRAEKHIGEKCDITCLGNNNLQHQVLSIIQVSQT